jgi:hypothetical protein
MELRLQGRQEELVVATTAAPELEAAQTLATVAQVAVRLLLEARVS